MAIIADQILPPPELPPGFKRRVVVKFQPNVQFSTSGKDNKITKLAGQDWANLTESFPGLDLVRYFSTLDESKLRNLTERSDKINQEQKTVNFSLYYAIECPVGVGPEEIAKAVSAWPNVEVANGHLY